MRAQPKASHFIDGTYVEDKAGDAFDCVYPATGEIIARLHSATPAIIEQAVAAATRAQKDWATWRPVARGRVLRRAAEIIMNRNRELSELETLDTGKPLQETLVAEATSGAEALEFFGGLAASINGETINLGQDFAYTKRVPLGVCVGIGAWNYPTQIACWKGAPALACGNAMIFKPSESTPLCALKIAEILVEAGAPKGLYNVVQGLGPVGAALTTHPGVAKVSLTGSVPTGRKVYAAAADGLRHVTMELGGKSPLIVFDDADIEDAVGGAMMGNFYSTGQVCSNGTRVFVQNGIREKFLHRLVERTAKIRIGDPMDEDVQMGPMVSAAQHAKVMSYIEIGKKEGADLRIGGGIPKVQGYEGGFFVEPTVFAGVTDDMTIAKEEIFGPVMAVLDFADEKEVIARANATQFGLSAGVFTRDLTRGHRVADRLEAGTLWINAYNLAPVEMPFGGSKMSGVGRENSREAINHYTEVKSIYVGMGKVDTLLRTQPNILIFMVDQLNGTLFPDGPADWLHAPNIKRLAARSTRFVNTYCASPLCAPSRASFMSGQLPRRTRVYDNAAEFCSDIPTYAHHLRRAGYHTCLSGKMHFVGPDQLHGFEERLTTDIYPADFGWTPDYRKPGERIEWWYHNMGSVTGAGVAEITNQMEYDDEVAYHATRKVYDLARSHDVRPWCLTVSFTHPHDPYVARRKHWDLYEDCEHLLPEVPAIPYEDHDPHSKRIFDANDWRSFDIAEADIRRSRRAYFANISYLDDKIGEVMEALESTGQEAIILFVSDHGDMLGERGLWFKMNFFEGSARVPLMVSAPDMPAGRIDTPVSTLDVLPTLADLVNADMAEVMPWTDGQSLVPLANGTERDAPVAMEYAAEASNAPLVGLRYGKWKYVHCELDPPQLYDLDADPQELTNLANDPAHAGTATTLAEKVRRRWDMASFDAEVRASQARRWVVYEALRNGSYYPWDYQPLQKASERYMRNHMDLNVVEQNARYPRGVQE